MRTGLRTLIGGIACLILAFSTPAASGETQPIPIAVADFDYADTSGEARDQRAEHAARLAAFADMIRADLERSGKYRVVPLACDRSPCTAGDSDPQELLAEARAAGAQLLLFGGIQKMSTLIQHGKTVVVDLEADRLVFERLLSFRGDTDEAWRHAGQFFIRDFLAQDFRL
jgi:Tol biopolymer transport system component